MASLSVVTRAHDAEGPYLDAFVRHHLALGCEAIHVCVPPDNSSQLITPQLARYPEVRLHVVEDPEMHFNEVPNVALPHITTTHLLAIDMDEYVETPSLESLCSHDYLALRWTIVPWLGAELPRNGLAGFQDGQRKYLVRTDLCEHLGIHYCTTKDGREQEDGESFLYHYVYRSFSDLFLKCAMGKYASHQETGLQPSSGRGINPRRLPVKFKMAAVYERIAQAAGQTHPVRFEVDRAREEALVAASSWAPMYERLRVAYEAYRSRLDLVGLLRRMEADTGYLTRGRIPHNRLARLADRSVMPQPEPKKWMVEPVSRRRARLIASLRSVFGVLHWRS